MTLSTGEKREIGSFFSVSLKARYYASSSALKGRQTDGSRSKGR